jgi:threonine dehydrogenase-like Zn-dependent dehydrogenase
MGLLCLAGLKHSGALRRIGIDLMEARRERAAAFGATSGFDPHQSDFLSALHEAIGRRGVDCVIEITGSLSGLRLATDIIKQRGKILIPSLYKTELFDFGHNLMFKSPTMHSVHPWYSDNIGRDLRLGLEAYVAGVLPIDRLITHTFPLEKINEAFELMMSPTPDFVKGIITN